MVAYRISPGDLEQRIEAHAPGWLAKAKTRTDGFRTAGKYAEASTIWSQVKAVYITLQQGKCIYCERKLESIQRGGLIEQDVEHFRPKGNVSAWVPSESLTAAGVTVSPVPNNPIGYYLLPYHVLNYAAACKPCNSILKRDLFPISGAYDFHLDDPREGLRESPLLLYPIGDFDADPEALIEFYGPSPRAKASHGYARHRALVTIEFFELDEPADPNGLYHGRSLVIMAVFPLFREAMQTHGVPGVQQVIDELQLGLPHLNCARSFGRLFIDDRPAAQSFYDSACALILGKS